jgi:putative DNA primase/helicase
MQNAFIFESPVVAAIAALSKENVRLKDSPLAELPGILLWAIQGWKRLRDRGRFIQPDAGKEALDDLADLTSPVGEFVRHCCKIGTDFRIERSALFDAWQRWCDGQGRERSDAGTFGRDLRSAVPSVGDGHPRIGGEKIRVYKGIRLNDGLEQVGTCSNILQLLRRVEGDTAENRKHNDLEHVPTCSA